MNLGLLGCQTSLRGLINHACGFLAIRRGRFSFPFWFCRALLRLGQHTLSGARRFGARWTPSDPYVESIIAIGEKNSDWTELARGALSIAPIFGVDMAQPRLIEGIACCLRGLIGGDARFYLRERVNDE